MKKSCFLVVLTAILFTSAFRVNAQEKKNLLKTSLLMPLAGDFQLSYERMLNTEMSLELAAGAGDFSYVNPQFRYYLSENTTAPTGTFVSPYLLLSDEMSGGGLTIGYQRLFKQKVSLEAFIGPLISENISVWGGINVGLAF